MPSPVVAKQLREGPVDRNRGKVKKRRVQRAEVCRRWIGF
jgi:hypothetical protein